MYVSEEGFIYILLSLNHSTNQWFLNYDTAFKNLVKSFFYLQWKELYLTQSWSKYFFPNIK